MKQRATPFSLVVLCVTTGVVLGCSTSQTEATASSTEPIESYEPLLKNARMYKTATQVRLENTIRDDCKGRQTVIDVRVGNNSADVPIAFSAVGHGYRNRETVPVQITRIGYFTALPYQDKAVPFDGKYPGVEGSASEVVSVTLDAIEGSTFDDANFAVQFLCGEDDRANAGYDPTTNEVADPSQISCADLGSIKGAALPMCEFNGNGACDGRGSRTNDCDHCCQAVGPGLTTPL